MSGGAPADRTGKWGVVERFRVRPQWRGRVEAQVPGLLANAARAREALLSAGAWAMGPYFLRWSDGEWWTVVWQFPSPEAAEGLRALVRDPSWSRFVEEESAEGPEFDPSKGLPGF